MYKTRKNNKFSNLAYQLALILTCAIVSSTFIAINVEDSLILSASLLANLCSSIYFSFRRVSKLNHELKTLADVISNIDKFKKTEILNMKNANELECLYDAIETLKTRTDDQLALNESQAKLTTIGEISANISHEILNPLTIITTRVALIRSRIKKKDQPIKAEDLDGIETAVSKISTIISNIRKLARNDNADDFEIFNVEDIFIPIDFLAGEKLRESHINFSTHIEDRELMVEGNDSLLTQVLLNLINNSRHAALEQQDKWIKVYVEGKKEDIIIKVIDSGPGIPKEISRRLFKERITTKSLEEGTGLGLPLCKKIIDQHRGSIWIEDNAPNTTFIIRIPKYDKEREISSKEVAA